MTTRHHRHAPSRLPAFAVSLALILGTSLPLSALAQPPAAAAAAVKPSPNATASAAIKAAVEGTVSAIRTDPVAKGGDPARTAQLVTTHFLPYTDFRRTARLATGAAWKTATPQQQDQIVTQFQALLVTVYAAQMTQIQGQDIQFQFDAPVTAPGSTDVVIGSKVHTNTDDLTTRYRLEKTPEGYKVYDIDLMGIWLIQVYRQQFANQLNQGGVDGLIKFLTAHNTRAPG